MKTQLKTPCSLSAAITVALLATACTSATGSFERTPSPGVAAECPPLTPSSFRATGAELREAHVPDLFEAVRRVRPRFLRSHAPRRNQSPVVYVDGVRWGSTDVLREIPVMDVVALVFMGAADATTRFGTDHTGGALLVRTQAGPKGRQCPVG